ncbi:Chitotriosidase-1 [Entamoeba marina]
MELPLGLTMTNIISLTKVSKQNTSTTLKNIAKCYAQQNTIGSEIPEVYWDDIGGCEQVKTIIKQQVEMIMKNTEKNRGILLYGPPGTGKTLLAKAIATEYKMYFFSIRGPEILDKNGGGVFDRIVSQILSELQGVNNGGGVLVIAATNRIDMIDKSLLVPGRFDILIEIPLVSGDDRRNVLIAQLSKISNKDVDYDEIIKYLPEKLSGADIFGIVNGAYNIARGDVIKRYDNGENVTNDDIVQKRCLVFFETQQIESCEGDPGDFVKPEKTLQKKVIGYYTNWSQYRINSINGWACKFTPELIDPTVFDVINYAFVVFDESYTVKEYEWNDNTMIPQVVDLKKQNPNLKVLCSIGGWNFNLRNGTKHLFSEMSEFEEGRKKFIQSSIIFARKYGLDGIDIDWEYPGHPDMGGREVDTISFTSLLKEFREAIELEAQSGKTKLLLTIAAPAGPKNIKNLELKEIHKYLDWINLMTYDLHGAWENVTGSHTALFSEDGLSVNDAVTSYLNSGIPSSKLMMGMGHYGRGWTLKLNISTSPSIGSPAVGASKAGICTREDGYMAKYEIDAFIPKNNIIYHDASMTMFGWKDDQFFSFDDSITFELKSEYLCAKNLGGAMVWAIDLDKNLVETKKIKEYVNQC